MEYEEIVRRMNELIDKKDRRIEQADNEIAAIKQELAKERAQNIALTTEIGSINKKISSIESLWKKNQ